MSRLLGTNGISLARVQGVKEIESEVGLVCITSTEPVHFRSLTRARYLTLRGPARREKLREIYEANLDRLSSTLSACAAQGVRLFSLSASVFPFSNEWLGREILEDLRFQLARVGGRAKRLGIRVVSHPSSAIDLASKRDSASERAVRLLEAQAFVLDLLGLPRTPWAAIEIRGGKSGRAPELISAILELPEPIRSRLALKNDAHRYGASEVLEISQETRVPMIFDAHQHALHDELDSYDHPSMEEMLQAAARTWPEASDQIVHVSNEMAGSGVAILPRCYALVPWIESESSQGEPVIQKSRLEWLRAAA